MILLTIMFSFCSPSVLLADEEPLVILDSPEDSLYYNNIYVDNLIVTSVEGEESETDETLETIDVLPSPAVLAAGNRLLQNCVAITGTFGGSTYVLYCPRSTWDNLSIDSNGILTNMLSSSVTLRMFGSNLSYGSPYRYLVLAGLNNIGNYSSYYNYGYADYMRTYTNISTGNYNTSYGNFYVTSYHVYRATDSFSTFFYLFLVMAVLWLYAFVRTHARMRIPGGK